MDYRGYESIINQEIAEVPTTSGIYKMIDRNGIILYIGKAKNLKDRLADYLRPEVGLRTKIMLSQLHRIETIQTKNDVDALILEAQLIRSMKPRYNILLKDDKSQPYIAISHHEYARLYRYRGKLNSREAEYFGPFTSSKMVNDLLDAMHKAFLLRSCSDHFFASRNKPCIEYYIHRCSAPCVRNISAPDYAQLVQSTIETLRGNSKAAQAKLLEKMNHASEHMQYEQAAIYRDRIATLKQTCDHTLSAAGVPDADFIALYRIQQQECCAHFIMVRNNYITGNKSYILPDITNLSDGEMLESIIMQKYAPNTDSNAWPKCIYLEQTPTQSLYTLKDLLPLIKKPSSQAEKTLMSLTALNAEVHYMKHYNSTAKIKENLKLLAERFALPAIPKRIEAYDNSHIYGTNAMAAMIVCGESGFIKSEYKRYSVEYGHDSSNSSDTTHHHDDYRMMRAVLQQRFTKYNSTTVPDLLIIDGGPGHLTTVTQKLKQLSLNIPVICIAKGPDRNAGEENFYSKNVGKIKFPRGDSLLLYLQSIRDEVHRFAITSHRKKRNSRLMRNSQINEIPHIGLSRKRNLLAYFGSIKNIAAADVTEIQKVKGIGKKMALYIKTTLNKLNEKKD